MKLIVAIVQSDKLKEVRESLIEARVGKITVSGQEIREHHTNF